MTNKLQSILDAAEAASKGPWEQGLQSNENSVFCEATPSRPAAGKIVAI
ncbi:hypothetical protein LCGC14_2267150, partial [marine sediment metagenome]